MCSMSGWCTCGTNRLWRGSLLTSMPGCKYSGWQRQGMRLILAWTLIINVAWSMRPSGRRDKDSWPISGVTNVPHCTSSRSASLFASLSITKRMGPTMPQCTSTKLVVSLPCSTWIVLHEETHAAFCQLPSLPPCRLADAWTPKRLS